MKIRRFLSVFLLTLLLTGLFCVPQASAVEMPQVNAKAALLMDYESGRMLYGLNEKDTEYPASITKVMTALLILEKVSGNETLLNQEVTASENAFSDTYYHADGSSAGIKAGEVMTVKQLLQCMLIVSANEACNVVAEYIAGDIPSFVALMNAQAAALGMTGTHFANAHGLHDENELLWKDYDVRRYAYWSVFAGSFGHTYGHNSIMQFIKPGVGGAYGAKKPWYDALNDPGYNQMKYLKNLMLTFPFFERIPDQSIITGQNGERYDRAIATRGNDYLMVYNYTGRPMEVDFSKISGAKKNAWWYTTKDGKLEYIGEFDNGVHKFQHDSGYCSGNDHILIVVDSSKNYVEKAWTELPNAQQKWAK